MSLLNFLVLSTATAAETSRTAEAILTGRIYKRPLPAPKIPATEQTSRAAEQLLKTSQSKQKIIGSSSTSKHIVAKRSKPQVTKQKNTYPTKPSQILSGVKIEVQSCKYVPEYKSITCDMTLTNQEHDMEVVIHCYTGTTARDKNGNNLECAHAWLGNNHSWNFAHGKLLQGKPVKGMVRLETRKAPVKLSQLEISLALNGVKQTMIVKNIPIQ